ncbi:MAG TPA: PEGA domain-containing protein [Candidatus Sumerlaeota bacterium]|nr:PEGA domain-containing protein [Candidatus Sumerlaeota bacterium]
MTNRILLIILALLALLVFSGCIRSRVVVTSEPNNADIRMNEVYRGRTPITIPFTWYWFYDFEVSKPGFDPMKSRERFRTPFWFYMPLDLFCEAMPFNIYDTKRLHYTLTPSLEEPAK